MAGHLAAASNWRRTQETDSLSDQKIIGFVNAGISQSGEKANLTILCSEKKNAVLVNTEISLADDEYRSGEFSPSQLVFARFDDEKPYSSEWRLLSGSKGLVQADEQTVRTLLSGGKAKLRLRLHSYSESQTYTFLLPGLDLREVHSACPALK